MKKLQTLIDRTVKAQNEFFHAQAALNDFCKERYGHEPGEVDADAIIDGVLGGCGLASSMSAKEFDMEMKKAIEHGGWQSR